ncbi:hypothetical protein L228DRAFT_245368 [Xylona heveae TC161]|uniref:Uncharacterized protein n=1 Tax=Xylona heveae (strain CBS 132557 / TC161) TaxID=1328760 RepID=A0A165I629_XYLHT|nr:hypothetical protein L228DRAFT_245368 [Xylona heveae TC161]KZF24439.1 hypothetical protein L228DRAFT_245368 [Xylona heveae TC161]
MATAGVTINQLSPSKWPSSPSFPSPSNLFRREDDFYDPENGVSSIKNRAHSMSERMDTIGNSFWPMHKGRDFESTSDSELAVDSIQVDLDISAAYKDNTCENRAAKRQIPIKPGKVKKPGVDGSLENRLGRQRQKPENSLSRYFTKPRSEDFDTKTRQIETIMPLKMTCTRKRPSQTRLQ